MRVACESNRRSELVVEACHRYAQDIAHELEIGRTYNVYGQRLSRGCLAYLIDPGDGQGLRRPNWYPSGWFKVTENSIPKGWVFMVKDNTQGNELSAIWGYLELANDPEHYVGLIEREEEAISIFLKRAGEIDRMQNRNNDMA